MNFSLALAAGRIPGVSPSWGDVVGPGTASAEEKQARLETALLGEPAAAKTHSTIAAQLASSAPAAAPSAGFEQAKGKPKVSGRPGDVFGAGIFRLGPEREVGPVDRDTALIAGLLFGSPDFQRF
jgi:hypothetical protein